jgi:hypothetical protein
VVTACSQLWPAVPAALFKLRNASLGRCTHDQNPLSATHFEASPDVSCVLFLLDYARFKVLSAAKVVGLPAEVRPAVTCAAAVQQLCCSCVAACTAAPTSAAAAADNPHTCKWVSVVSWRKCRQSAGGVWLQTHYLKLFRAGQQLCSSFSCCRPSSAAAGGDIITAFPNYSIIPPAAPQSTHSACRPPGKPAPLRGRVLCSTPV